MSFLAVAAAAMSGPVFEDLGQPVVERELGIWQVTPKAARGYIAWGQRKRTAVVGIDVETGKSFELNIAKYGRTNIVMAKAPDGSLVYYAGSPGRFFRYTTEGKLDDLGVPGEPASYWIGGAVSPDQVLYVGTYPAATLMACDLRTWKVSSCGKMTDDVKEKYIISVAVSDEGMVYCSVGLHHQELWCYDPATGSRTQILPAQMLQEQGAPRIWTGTDGHVYGRARGDLEFRCAPDRIETGKTLAQRGDPAAKRAGDWTVTRVDQEGVLTLAAKGKEPRTVQTDYPGRALEVYSVGCERQGRIYGGTLFPGQLFCYDPDAKRFVDMPDATPGAIQIYDIHSQEKGVFLASYMGCKLDFFEPNTPISEGENPRRFKGGIAGQERPVQWEPGPDGNLYFGTTPAKGRLGGALVRVNPETFEVRTWAQIVQDQSIQYLCSVKETGELFGCATVNGGSSAIPTQEAADVFLWDINEEKVVWRGQPITGTTSYLRAVRAPNGLIVGLTGDQWYLFDPLTRAVVHRAPLPVGRLYFPCLSDPSAATCGLAVGIGDDAVFAIDAEKRTATVLVRDPSFKGTRGFLVAADGTLYYGSGTALRGCRGIDFKP